MESADRATKGISILNPIGGYARPFHLETGAEEEFPLSLDRSETGSSLFTAETSGRYSSRRTSTNDSL